MSKKPLVVDKFKADPIAEAVSMMWRDWHMQRVPKLNEWKELRNYVFATDTSTTANSALPWKNKTTIPKLCQIRDNLFSNYISSLFPNDSWLEWEAWTREDSDVSKSLSIKAYMSNKCRTGDFRKEIEKILYDYIDYGSCFATCEYVTDVRYDDAEQQAINYIGPKARRISPLDIVFNPIASSFEESPKIIRSVFSEGELVALSQVNPDNEFYLKAIEGKESMRTATHSVLWEDLEKQDALYNDGFGNLQEYLNGNHIEILEFYGNIYDSENKELKTDRIITVANRCQIIRDIPLNTWGGYAPIFHAGWRPRPDNLWAMGPLDNLVGMQYRIDHLENLKADACDLAVLPPLVIKGDVERFDYGPNVEIHVDTDGDVTELARNAQWVIQADNEIQLLEQRMEMYAGAPREAMGIRSPGEKTMYEVQQLENAAGRIFKEKVTSFEVKLMEPLLNGMLECSARNLNGVDTVRVINNDLGAVQFKQITKEDITANGRIRPIGARHFAEKAQLMQNLLGVLQSPAFALVQAHTSGKALAALFDDVLGTEKYKVFRPNVAIFETTETQALAAQAQEDLEVQQRMAVDSPAGMPNPITAEEAAMLGLEDEGVVSEDSVV